MIATFTFDIDPHFVATHHIVLMSQSNPPQGSSNPSNPPSIRMTNSKPNVAPASTHFIKAQTRLLQTEQTSVDGSHPHLLILIPTFNCAKLTALTTQQSAKISQLLHGTKQWIHKGH